MAPLNLTNKDVSMSRIQENDTQYISPPSGRKTPLV